MRISCLYISYQGHLSPSSATSRDTIDPSSSPRIGTDTLSGPRRAELIHGDVTIQRAKGESYQSDGRSSISDEET
jgi:hypothetical protein